MTDRSEYGTCNDPTCRWQGMKHPTPHCEPRSAAMTGDNALKACPGCRGTKIRDEYIRDGRRVFCACGWSVHAYAPDALKKARDLWNTRSPVEDARGELVEALEVTRGTVGDLRKGFAPDVDPARWVEQLQAYIDTALAKSLPSPRGWQDIATAPKDGTRVIVAKIGWCHSTLERLRQSIENADLEPDEYRVFFATSAHFHEKRQYWTDGLERLVEPTHWMPLPSPPESPK